MGLFGEVESFFNLWERVKSKSKAEPTLVSRFVEVFEKHGVHRNQIPRFFGHGLTLADVATDDRLLPKLNDELLQDLCEKFAIRREWLDGASSQIYPINHFYKYPKDFDSFLKTLINSNGDQSDFSGFLVISDSLTPEADAVLVLEEVIGSVGEKNICRYHFCDTWRYEYWKSRAYLTSCLAFSYRNNCHIYGRVMPEKKLIQYREGNKFFTDHKLESGRRFEPEDLIYLPEKFLNGIDPERDNFGRISALSLWIDLAEDDCMTGYVEPDLDKFMECYRVESSKNN
jgi:hypothetical protein